MRPERGVVVPLSSSPKAGKRWRLSGRGGRKRLRVADASVSEMMHGWVVEEWRLGLQRERLREDEGKEGRREDWVGGIEE